MTLAAPTLIVEPDDGLDVGAAALLGYVGFL